MHLAVPLHCTADAGSWQMGTGKDLQTGGCSNYPIALRPC